MDGRKTVALLAATAALLTSCNRISALPVIGAVGSSIAEVTPPQIDRPPLRKIFRPGRFVFRPAPGVTREFEALLEDHPLGAEATRKVVAKLVLDTRGEIDPVYAIAIVFSRMATRDPHTWDGFVRGLEENAGVPADTNTLGGVETVHVEVRRHQVFGVDYERDLVVRLEAMARTPLPDLKSIARYLLRARR